jgi:nitroreductase
MDFIENQKWRYATKKFDTSKKISSANLEKIKESINLAATSYGLQLFKVLIIENPETREILEKHSWGQSQLTEASHLMVFCNFTSVKDEHIDSHLQLKSKLMGIEESALKGYGNFMKSKTGEMTPEQTSVWNAKQTYIALGNAMAMCAELKIDTCPLEGFSPEEYNSTLGLHKKGLESTVVLTLGYRSAEDKTQHSPKVIKNLEDLFEYL